MHSDSCFLQSGLEDAVKDIVGQTSGFMPRDLRALAADAGASLISKCNTQVDEAKLEEMGSSRGVKVVQDDETCNDIPNVMGKEYLPRALERSKKRNASALGTPKVSYLTNGNFNFQTIMLHNCRCQPFGCILHDRILSFFWQKF